jgi:hypothetical protein
MKDPLTVTAAAAGGAVVAGPAGAAVAAGAAAATLDIADATKGEEAAEDKVDAITKQLLDDAIAQERGAFQGIIDDLWFWLKAGIFGLLGLWGLRHTKDILRFLRYIKLLPKKDA